MPNGNRLIDLIYDLLDTNKIKEGTLIFDLVPCMLTHSWTKGWRRSGEPQNITLNNSLKQYRQ